LGQFPGRGRALPSERTINNILIDGFPYPIRDIRSKERRVMEEEQVIDVKRRLVGRVPYRYQLDKNARTLEADSGFGRVGAKMDPRTGALMYEKFEDWIVKQKIMREEIKESNIRFSEDSSAIVDIREKEEGRFALDGTILEHSARGVLSVFNRSDKDRIWDIEVGVRSEGQEAELDFDRFSVTELEAGKRESRTYPIRLLEPSMALEEVVSSHPDHPQSTIVLPGRPNHISLQLGIKNMDTIPYREVLVTKAIPKELKNIIFPGEADEDVQMEGGKLLWKIKGIEPGEIRILDYEGDIETDSVQAFATGDVVVSAISSDLTTSLVVDSFEAMCRNMYMIEADETDEPGVWICRFIIENTSQFEVEVRRIEVKDAQNEEVYIDLEDPGTSIVPGSRWESKEWTVARRERPSFIKNLVLNVVPGIYMETRVELVKDGGLFRPAALGFTKAFDRKKVEARRETPLEVEIILENMADAEIEQVFLRDEVPPYIRPPSFSEIRVTRDGVPMSGNVSAELQPSDFDPFSRQQLYLRIDDLSINGGTLKRGEKLVVNYSTDVVRPEPDSRISSAAEVDARTYMPGPMIAGKALAEFPTLEITHVLRKFTVGKSVEQGRSPGSYSIQLLYRNRGNQKISDLVMRDILPENFTAASFSREPSQERSPEGFVILNWKIPEIAPGEALVIGYDIKGSGEYHPKDAQIFYNMTMD